MREETRSTAEGAAAWPLHRQPEFAADRRSIGTEPECREDDLAAADSSCSGGGAIIGLLGVGVVWAVNSPESQARALLKTENINGDPDDFASNCSKFPLVDLPSIRRPVTDLILDRN